MTIGGSVHFANITGPLFDAGKEFRQSSSSNPFPLSISLPFPFPDTSRTDALMNESNGVCRSRIRFLRRFGRFQPRRRLRTLWWFARPTTRCTSLCSHDNRNWFLDRGLGHQAPRALVGDARGGVQFWHRHLGHLHGVQFYKRRPSDERRLSVSCQSEQGHI